MSSETAEDDEEYVEVEEPVDSDVLCGRGGAALRHPGNQTYRRLVHLNKGLYITCLKAEKLKISRSIVAAIREQNGRFLERDIKKGTWYDIGDKKAMEKTSQALREGQPKLRQKIVELGGGAAGAAALLETQFPSGNMFAVDQQQQQQQYSLEQQQQQFSMEHQQQQHQNQQQVLQQMQDQGMFNSAEAMPPPHNLSMRNYDMPLSGETPTIQEDVPGVMRKHSLTRPQRGSAASDFGIDPQLYSQLSLMSDFSNNFGMEPPTSQFSIPSAPHYLGTPNSLASVEMSVGSATSQRKQIDRRKHFARMKFSRPPSGRLSHHSGSSKQLYASNRSLSDGMPDIHLVESQHTLSSRGTEGVPENIASIFESRRSLMSGLSRISDTDANSMFSDLSRKIGNVSTRSIAMSEISVMDHDEHSHHLAHELDPDSIPTANLGDDII